MIVPVVVSLVVLALIVGETVGSPADQRGPGVDGRGEGPRREAQELVRLSG